MIQALVCTNIMALGQYVAKFRLLLTQLKATGSAMPDAVVLDLLRRQLANVKPLEATLESADDTEVFLAGAGVAVVLTTLDLPPSSLRSLRRPMPEWRDVLIRIEIHLRHRL